MKLFGENSFFDINPFSDASQALAALHELTEHPEIENATYFAVNLPVANDKTGFAVSTYSDDWHKHYFANCYQRIDPIVARGLTQIAPFDWAKCKPKNKAIDRFFGEAGEFGVAKQGFSVPIRGKRGDYSLFSLNSNLPQKEWQNFLTEHRRDIINTAFMFHMAVVDMGDENDVKIKLAPRELEVLQWAASGKTTWETSRIMGIGRRTVESYLLNARAKLRCATTAQAVARGSLHGLIY